jgi:hypothetical protein
LRDFQRDSTDTVTDIRSDIIHLLALIITAINFPVLHRLLADSYPIPTRMILRRSSPALRLNSACPPPEARQPIARSPPEVDIKLHLREVYRNDFSIKSAEPITGSFPRAFLKSRESLNPLNPSPAIFKSWYQTCCRSNRIPF